MEGKIPLLDMTPEIESIWTPLMAAIEGAVRGGRFIMGPNVKAFEEEIAAYLGVKHAVGCNSGTDALVLAMRALNLGPGDEVITTPFTFFATAECVSHVGATPVFVDIDPVSFNIDPSLIEAKITPRTKAIIPVHLYGHSCDMDAIMAIAEQHGLKVIEDVAQAFGARYSGRKVAAIGHAGALSFFPSKNLGAFGDGGMLVTNDDEIAAAARMLRVHGAKKKYFNETVGYNSRLDELQAAILRVKLPHLDEWNAGRRRAAEIYNELLRDVDGIVTPESAVYTDHVFHQYTVRIANGRRDEVQQRLKEAGIDTMVYYPVCLHRLPLYESMGVSLPLAERASAEALSLPIWPTIERGIQERVVEALKSALGAELAMA
ncbi:MAG: DegT/DnrJ/EryC1/StrS family aminotransferase [Armatimonadetes bacterium]|nr:DegT/DnrJ/EryC1/StrS family aminotransferase [Armatimonadota bacterium]